MNKMKNFFSAAGYYGLSLLVGTICLFFPLVFFATSTKSSTMIAEILNLKIYSPYNGGEIAQKISFSESDGSDFSSASGIKSYTVRKPTFGGKQPYPEYWQLEIEFSGEKEASKPLEINISLDSDVFQSNKWNFFIKINGNECIVYDSNQEKICSGLTFLTKNNTVRCIKFPVSDKRLQKVYAAKNAIHQIETSSAKSELLSIKMK